MAEHPTNPDPTLTAKARVAQRAELRADAAARGHLLPAGYQDHLRAQFTADAREARRIVAAHH